MKRYVGILASLLILLSPLALAQPKPTISIQKPAQTVQKVVSDASNVYAKNSSSVVVIEATDQSGSYQGSGVAFRNGGKLNPDKSYVLASTWIVTNAHVVKTASIVSVIVDGLHSKAEVKYRDSSLDIAILWVDGLVIPPVGKLEKWGNITPGEPVYAIGAPKGLPRTITEGIVSAIRTNDGNKYIQTSAAISPGSSGGGLFDRRGNLIGITTFKVVGGESLNFALDANQAVDLMDSISVAEMLRTIVDKQYIHQVGDEFVKWLSKEPSSSGGRISDEFNQAQERFFKDSDFKKFTEYQEGIINRYFEFVDKSPIVNPPQQKSPNEQKSETLIRLVCQTVSGPNMPKLSKTITFAIDFNKRTVNGHDATFTEGYIKYSFTKDQTRYDYLFDRVASTVNITFGQFNSALSGPCSKAEGRAF